MSSIYELKDKTYKIIIAGPVGAGKTEAIRSLSDTGVVTTEEIATDHIKNIKKTTTVAMDYGVMKLPGGESVRLYGTPGQRRFDFMWEILSQNALGLVVLLNAEEQDPVEDLHYYLDSFMPLISSSALVVGVTHAEDAPWDLHDRLTMALIERGVAANVMMVDARVRTQMQGLIAALMHMIA